MLTTITGQQFLPLVYHNPASIQAELQQAIVQRDASRAVKLQALLATAEGRYDYSQLNLHRAFPNIKPISFQDWFTAKWQLQS